MFSHQYERETRLLLAYLLSLATLGVAVIQIGGI